MIFTIIELVLVAIIIGVVVTQIFIPAVRGTLLWPAFKKTSKLENELAKAEQENYDANLETQVKRVRRSKQK